MFRFWRHRKLSEDEQQDTYHNTIVEYGAPYNHPHWELQVAYSVLNLGHEVVCSDSAVSGRHLWTHYVSVARPSHTGSLHGTIYWSNSHGYNTIWSLCVCEADGFQVHSRTGFIAVDQIYIDTWLPAAMTGGVWIVAWFASFILVPLDYHRFGPRMLVLVGCLGLATALQRLVVQQYTKRMLVPSTSEMVIEVNPCIKSDKIEPRAAEPVTRWTEGEPLDIEAPAGKRSIINANADASLHVQGFASGKVEQQGAEQAGTRWTEGAPVDLEAPAGKRSIINTQAGIEVRESSFQNHTTSAARAAEEPNELETIISSIELDRESGNCLGVVPGSPIHN